MALTGERPEKRFLWVVLWRETSVIGESPPQHTEGKKIYQKRDWQQKGWGRQSAHFLAFLSAGAAFDPCLDLSELEPAWEGCFCWLLLPRKQQRQGSKRLPEMMTSELKTGHSCPPHPHNPIPTGFCSLSAVGVAALMGRRKQLFTYHVEWLFPYLSQPSKTNTAFFLFFFFCLTLGKKKENKIEHCSVKWLLPPPKLSTPLETKRKYNRFNFNYHFHLQWVWGGGESWISNFSLCHQEWIHGYGADWSLVPASSHWMCLGDEQWGEGGTRSVYPLSLLQLDPGFPNILEKFLIIFFYF